MRLIRCSLLFALLFGVVLKSQNTDISSERLSEDYRFLRMLDGTVPVGSYAISPVTLRGLMSSPSQNHGGMLSSMRNTLRSLYAPLLEASARDTSAWFETPEGRFHVLDYRDSVVHLQCDAGGMLRGGVFNSSGNSKSFVLGNLSGRAMGSMGSSLSFGLYLSNGALLHGDQSYVKLTDPVLSRTLKFTELEQKFFDRYIGYVQYESEHFRARFGRDQFSWGYSPIDNLVHSRFAPLSDGLFLDVPYGRFRFSSVHVGVDGNDVKGNPILGKFIASHRLQYDPSSWMSFGINDMVVYNGRGLDFAYFNPLAFYVSTGLGTRNRSESDNSLLGFDLAARPWHRGLVYAALLLDDFSFDSMTDTTANGNNNKYAFQLGASQWIDVLSKPLVVSAEYVRVSAFCYSHRQINNSWTHAGAPLGYDIQPNSDRWAVQVKTWLLPRTWVQVDFDYTRWGENYLDSAGHIKTAPYVTLAGDTLQMPVGNVGADMSRGDGDFMPFPFNVGNHFLRGNISYTKRVQLQLGCEIIPNVNLEVRTQYTNRSGGNAPIDQWWFSTELRVGY